MLLSGNTNYIPIATGSYFVESRNITSNCISENRTRINLIPRSCTVITNRRITYRVHYSSTTPTGILTNDLVINNFDDGQNGAFSPYQLQVQNNTAVGFSYQIFIENVSYANIPGLNLGNHTLVTNDNGDGTYNYLFTSTLPLGAFQNTIISGSGSAPSPQGIGAACLCTSFYKL